MNLDLVIPELKKVKSIDEKVDSLTSKLEELGYSKYVQVLKNEDYSYFKTYVSEDGVKKYQIGLLFYDFRKYDKFDSDIVSVQYWCLLFDADGRVDLTVSKDISLTEFEAMAESFYKSMKEYID